MSDLLNQASLVMVPSGYKEDTVYSVVPSDGSGDLSFTRASNGTRVNSAGLVEVCPWNLVQQSETLDNTAWTKQQSTVTANAITAPNGTATADFLVPNTNNDLHSIFQTSGITSGKYTISVYAKQGGYKNLLVWFDGHSGGIGVNLDTLAIFRNQNNDGYLIETLANGWYRISVTCTISTASLPNFYIYDNSSTPAISFAGNGTSGVYLWGAQMNYGALKPYFPTTDRLNVPRLTYQNGGGGCPSLLLEKQSTNYITYSEQFDNAAWAKNGISLSANQIISPDGTQNADKLTTNDPSGSVYRIYETTSIGSDNVCSVSCYFKYDNWQYAYIVADNYSGVGKLAVFDVINGINTFVSTGYTATIESVGNNWYKCCLIGEMGSTAYTQFGIAPTSTAYNNISIANGKNLYLWGTQREVSSYATSYIPTTSSSATRVADACFKTGISSLIGQTEGTLYYELQRNNTDNDSRLQISDGTTNNWFFVSIESGLVPRLYCVVGGTLQFSVYGSSVDNGFHKVAVAYKNNDFKVYIDGVASITQTSGSVPTCSQLDIGNSSPNGAVVSPSQIKEVVLFKTRLTNAELASITSL